MPAPCIIREARPSDLDTLVELLGLLFSLESDFEVDGERQRAGLEMMLANGQGRLVLVAECSVGDTARVMGMATAQIVISTAQGGPALLVEDVVIRPEGRGKGLGRALLARIESWGLRLGASRLQLLADKNNTGSHDFYKACGFAPTNLVCLRRTLP
jgi:GNAT superfamily N-acetyltransferase